MNPPAMFRVARTLLRRVRGPSGAVQPCSVLDVRMAPPVLCTRASSSGPARPGDMPSGFEPSFTPVARTPSTIWPVQAMRASTGAPVNVMTIAHGAVNAIDSSFLASLLATLDSVDLKIPLVFTGSESSPTFSAGLNLGSVFSMEKDQLMDFIDHLESVLWKLFSLPTRTVCALNGHAIAGGLCLAMCADSRVVVSREDASKPPKLGLTEMALGLNFPPRLLSILMKKLRPDVAQRALMENEMFTPLTAHGARIVDHIVHGGYSELIDKSVEIAGTVNENNRNAYRKLKQAVLLTNRPPPEEYGTVEDFVEFVLSPSVQQRVRIVLEATKKKKNKEKEKAKDKEEKTLK